MYPTDGVSPLRGWPRIAGMRSLILSSLITLFVAISLAGQAPAPNDLDRLRQELQDALHTSDLVRATDLAAKLDDGVQREFRASLNRDAGQRINDVLNWLPSDTESLLVLQEPTVIQTTDTQQWLAEGAPRQYAFGRLMALNEGDIFRKLEGRTVRMVVAGIKSMQSRMPESLIIPAFMPDGDVAYFYFFTEPVGREVLGAPEASSNAWPLWRGTAQIDAGEPRGGGTQRAQREDSSWLALARPDLLIVCSRRETLLELLGRIASYAPAQAVRADRALPTTLPIWSQADRKAQFWGVRLYSDPAGRRDLSNARGRTVNGAEGDPSGVGVTVRFDVDSGDLEIRYLGTSRRPFDLDSPHNSQFSATQLRNRDWQLNSNTHDRGNYPFDFAAFMLGFGGYR
jgi:hypothetical protein